MAVPAQEGGGQSWFRYDVGYKQCHVGAPSFSSGGWSQTSLAGGQGRRGLHQVGANEGQARWEKPLCRPGLLA